MKTVTSLLGRQTLLDFKKILAHQFFHPNAPFCDITAKLKKVGFFLEHPDAHEQMHVPICAKTTLAIEHFYNSPK